MESFSSLTYLSSFSSLTSKLNKYLINIIDQYYSQNINNLITNQLSIRIRSLYYLNKDLTIEDIIIKCFHRGYKGFMIFSSYPYLVIQINNIINNSINSINIIDRQSGNIKYCFKNDKRDLYFINIIDLDDIFKIGHLISKNE